MMTEIDKYREVSGNLVKLALEGNFDVIAHGCNCFHSMGAGLAVDIAQNFKDAVRADKETPYGDEDKLGTYSVGVQYLPEEDRYFRILNIYSQHGTRNRENPNPVDYDAIREALEQVNTEFKWQRVGLPLIGCGLAGGDWTVVRKIIKETLTDVDVTIVHFDPNA